MKSRLPQATRVEPLPVRVSYLIVWTTTTGALATPCLSPPAAIPPGVLSLWGMRETAQNW